ncbi:phosphomevalonate kinase, peroxisomal-like isoform X2 [Prosopis cineraria]|nr:phosphomevalonate kinase, peroxisomal-like isoform X2 [Prosopis cineraria]XP_054775734.1 phosphomevalonate kinase, peroxisomal-like isoform X2 [Prosopis cineraria]XP_054792140.1 phosphomevalonate kinase, peroxisomal-like isoform X2 [Prosopis cineraria]XP_054792141.1 phosphomevalonate kinase, peroxisomal-like isoform X2 [Prosopis cineraria]
MTGGYLILERPNSGLVLSTNARFYAIVKPLFEEPKSDSCAGAWTDVKLTSPQLSREGMYKLDLENLTIQCVSSSETGNPFVEYAVQYSVAAAQAAFDKNMKDLLLQGLGITILGCNDFYSYRNQIEELGLPLTTESLANFPPFTSITFNVENVNGGNCKPEVAKTGLGSSAAMTTAVVASVLHYLGVVKLSSSKDYQARKDTADLDVVHKIAQTAHCVAQGKIGSGFDVCSAVYGSQRYVRFSPELISSAQGAERAVPLPEVIAGILKGKWDHEKTEFSLPPLVTLLLGEPGTGGSSTPSMVGAVKKWQKSDPHKSLDTWRRLLDANSALEGQLNLLTKLSKEQWDAYKCVKNNCSMLTSDKWIEQAFEPNKEAVVNALLGAKDAMLLIRSLMRKMGEAAGVPIEPESQTRLLDATMKLEGVMLAGVPGAGGFDAIFAVILGDSSKNVTQVWSSLNVLALLVREYPCGVCVESVDPRTNAVTSTVSSVHSQ